MYHSRLYAAADFVKTRDDLDLIQLNSFGCGLDAVTTDQVSDILTDCRARSIPALKIDEVSNLGAARIRIRSLLAAVRERERRNQTGQKRYCYTYRVVFTEQMRKDYTILCSAYVTDPFRYSRTGTAHPADINLEVLTKQPASAVDLRIKVCKQRCLLSIPARCRTDYAGIAYPANMILTKYCD